MSSKKQNKYGELRLYLDPKLYQLFKKEAEKEERIFSKQMNKILEDRYQPKE